MHANQALLILIADDDVALCATLAAYARLRGHVALVAQDGPRALVVAASESPDVVLLDVSMPKLDGRDVLCELKRHPRTASIPVVVATGHGDDPHLCALLYELGASDVIAKPLTLAETYVRLERAVERGRVAIGARA